MRSCRVGCFEKRRTAIGRKITTSPNQNSGSAHCSAKRPALYAIATRNSPIALVKLSTGSHPHAPEVNPFLFDNIGNSGASSLTCSISSRTFAVSTSVSSFKMELLFDPGVLALYWYATLIPESSLVTCCSKC